MNFKCSWDDITGLITVGQKLFRIKYFENFHLLRQSKTIFWKFSKIFELEMPYTILRYMEQYKLG